MKKFGKVIVTIFKVLLVLWLLLLMVYMSVAIFNQEIDNKFVIEKGNFGRNPTYLADGNTHDADTIYASLAANGTSETAYLMYELACKKMMLAKSWGLRAKSDIFADALDYTIDVTSNRTEQYYTPGTPTLNANQKVLSSYTNTIYITHVSDEFLEPILKAAVMFADRGYADGEKSYKQKGKLEVMEDENEKITWSTKYSEVDTSADRKYEDSDVREKCNFIINRTTIIPDSATVTREDAEGGQYRYVVGFDLSCSGAGKQNAAYYEEKALKDTLGTNLRSIVYDTLHIDFYVYSNGYMTYWESQQAWTLNYKAGIFDLYGSATINKKEVMSYDHNECEVVDFTE